MRAALAPPPPRRRRGTGTPGHAGARGTRRGQGSRGGGPRRAGAWRGRHGPCSAWRTGGLGGGAYWWLRWLRCPLVPPTSLIPPTHTPPLCPQLRCLAPIGQNRNDSRPREATPREATPREAPPQQRARHAGLGHAKTASPAPTPKTGVATTILVKKLDVRLGVVIHVKLAKGVAFMRSVTTFPFPSLTSVQPLFVRERQPSMVPLCPRGGGPEDRRDPLTSPPLLHAVSDSRKKLAPFR